MLKRALKLTFVLIFVTFTIPNSAQAYLDPGSGSYLIQIVIAAVAGGGFLLKNYWGKIKDMFGKSNKGNENEKEE